MGPLTDEELVESYRAHPGTAAGRASLDELFQRYHSKVATWCFRLTGDRESAADLAQEVFLKVFRNLDSFRGHSKFSTWLYSIARNHCFNEVKARASRPETVDESVLPAIADTSQAGPLTQLGRNVSAQTVRDLIHGTLDETEAQVMTLHYAEDLSLDAITRLLRLENASGAKAYIVSAKRKLSRAVAQWRAREERITR